MLYGSETWCLRENEMAILRRTERAMVRVMCGAKLIKKKRTEEEEDVEDASGEGEQERGLGEKGCHESRETESGC